MKVVVFLVSIQSSAYGENISRMRKQCVPGFFSGEEGGEGKGEGPGNEASGPSPPPPFARAEYDTDPRDITH